MCIALFSCQTGLLFLFLLLKNYMYMYQKCYFPSLVSCPRVPEVATDHSPPPIPQNILDYQPCPTPTSTSLAAFYSFLKKMSLSANRVRVVQHGDAVMGERTQLVYDEETGMVGQKKTVVAQVPVEGGGHAILVTEQVQVTQVVKPRA